MALQKQKFTLNLVQGTDTKTNDQIDNSYKDMKNVVFSGDLTAKKMNGYDKAGELPADEYYSNIFTKGNELLAQTEKGVYKLYESLSQFKKIENIGSTSIDKLPSYGEVFCAGQDFDMHVGFFVKSTYSAAGTFSYNSFYRRTFTDKKGAVVNVIETEFSMASTGSNQNNAFRWVQAIASGNDFFVTRSDLNSKLIIEKLTYDSGTQVFSVAATAPFNGTGGRRNITFQGIRSLDIYTDGNFLYFATLDSGATTGELYKINYSTLATVILNTTFTASSGVPQGSFKIVERDANNIYVGWCSFNTGATPGPANYAFLEINIHLKSDLSKTAENTCGVELCATGVQLPYFTYVILGDISVKYFYTVIAVTSDNGTNTATPGFTFFKFQKGGSFFGTPGQAYISNAMTYHPGVIPVSDIFEENGGYYALVLCSIGHEQIFHVINVDNGAPVATLDYSAVSPFKGTYLYNYNLCTWNSGDWYLYALKRPYKQNGVWVVPTKPKPNAGSDTTADPTYLRTIDFNASTINQQVEMVGKANIFNGQPAYYDGKEVSELGFMSAPFLQGCVSDLSGGFLSNGTYQILAIYRYQDAEGNVFHSNLSNIIGSGYELTLTGGSAVQRIRFNLYTPIVSTKDNVEVIIYVKKGSDQFSRNQSFFITPGQNPSQDASYEIYIKAYNAAPATSTIPDLYLYATSTFAAGGDYPTSPLTDSVAAAIYEDRVFTISRDDQNSIAYSQQRIQGYGLEFTKDIFYIDVYDKRGVYEDKLSALIAMDGRLFIFKERSILYIVGSGPSRANTQNDLSSPQLVTTDVGCIASKSLVLVPDGIMFMSDKGVYLLNRKLQVEYIGAPVERFNSNTITSAVLLEKVNEVRFTTLEGELLVYNYYSKLWSWFTDLPSAGACIWKGAYTVLLTDGRVFTESLTHKKIIDGTTETEIVQTISTPWLRLDGEQGWEKVYECLILGTYKSPHQLKASVYYDYELYASEEYTIDPLDASDYNVTVKPTNNEIESGVKTNGVYQFRIDMIRKNCQAFRIVIQDIPDDIENNTGECFALSNITITAGVKKGPAKIPASKSY